MAHPDWFQDPGEPCCDKEIFVHESSYVDEPCQIGHATHVMHFCHLMQNSMIGRHCQIGHNVTIASGVLVGNHVRILNNALLSSGVIMEDNVYCGPSTVFTPLKYIRGEAANISSIQPALVKRGASIGANTTIAAGLTIGQHAFVESGSVVDRNIPDFAIVYGNPVQFAGWRCECGQSLKFSIAETTQCPRCGKKYARHSEMEVVALTPEGKVHDSHIQPASPIHMVEKFH